MSANTSMTVPAHIANRVAARRDAEKTSSVMTAIVSGDGFPYPKLSIRAGRYRLVEEGVETPVGISLDVIIVGANPRVSKIFYGKPYDPNATDMRPDCFSNDGIKPDASVQNPVHDNCQNCPNNVLGSKITPSGAKSKLCADQRHLAVVPAADPTKTYAFTVPVSGMKALREYFKSLNNFNFVPEEVITELGFDDTTSYPKVTFKHKGFVPEKAIPKVEAIVNGEEVQEIVRLKAPSQHAALSAPAAASTPQIVAPAPQATQPAPVAAPAVDDAYDDDAPVAAEQPTSNVSASSALESKLDSLFE